MAKASADSTTSGRPGVRAGSQGMSHSALRRRTSCQLGKSAAMSGSAAPPGAR